MGRNSVRRNTVNDTIRRFNDAQHDSTFNDNTGTRNTFVDTRRINSDRNKSDDGRDTNTGSLIFDDARTTSSLSLGKGN